MCAAVQAAEPVRELLWDDIVPSVQRLLNAQGIDAQNFRERAADLRERNRRRVVEGDRDHLIYYILQSTAFTKLPPIEPALSAKELAESGRIPSTARARIDAFAAAAKNRRDYGPRMAIFREILARDSISIVDEYARAMKLAAPARDQYQARGLSTDSSIDANYVVYLSLGALRALEPDRRIRSVLIVGPGLDLAPRTSFVEVGAPQSYQPFAVVDALLATGLATRDTLRVTAADINPRVSTWVRDVRGTRPTLTVVAGIQQTGQVKLSEDFRQYFAALGGSIGEPGPLPDAGAGRLGKTIAVARGVTDGFDAATLDITVERLDARFDLVVVTNVFPYLSDAELLLAVSNIAAMLNPAGILIHNEPRPVLADALLALQMPLLQTRSAVVATVTGGNPLYDAAWMHRSR